MNEPYQEAVAYFKSNQAYHTIFLEIRKKYESLGRIGGTIPIRLLSEKEMEVLSRYFGQTQAMLKTKKSFSISKFADQLAKTRFADCEFKQLLDTYFGETILSKKEQQVQTEQKQIACLREYSDTYEVLRFWFTYLHKNERNSYWILRLMNHEQAIFKGYVKNLAMAMAHLPETGERLPMFSTSITGNPHSFDVNTDQGKLFLHLLAVKHASAEKTDPLIPKTTEDINELLESFHIYRDDLLNFVTCTGLLAETMDHHVHPVWAAMVEMNTILNIPLKEIIPLKRIYPSNGNHVWIVENSGVCSTLCDSINGLPIIATNGQFNLAAWKLLDHLAHEGCIMHYAGDFDPEGLQMAERFVDRYPDQVRLWHMDMGAYEKSHPQVPLTNERLEKLTHLTNPILQQTARQMKKYQKAGYQEALVERMIQELQDCIQADNS